MISQWLFLDYDGTLADFMPTPEDITPIPRIVSLFKRLATKSNVRLTVISGRKLADLRSLLPVPGIYLAGTYGIELQLPTGELIQRTQYERVRPYLEMIKPMWIEIIGNRARFFLEDKGWTLGLHARFSKDEEAFEAIHARGGIAVKVVSGSPPSLPTKAKYIPDSPPAVNSWLETLLARL